jgi:hypothetical protein
MHSNYRVIVYDEFLGAHVQSFKKLQALPQTAIG